MLADTKSDTDSCDLRGILDSANIVQKDFENGTSNSETLSEAIRAGMYRQLTKCSMEISQWISAILSQSVSPNLFESLSSGSTLCKLIEITCPSISLPSWYKSPDNGFERSCNFDAIRKACEQLEIDRDLIVTMDIFDEKQNIGRLVTCLLELKDVIYRAHMGPTSSLNTPRKFTIPQFGLYSPSNLRASRDAFSSTSLSSCNSLVTTLVKGDLSPREAWLASSYHARSPASSSIASDMSDASVIYRPPTPKLHLPFAVSSIPDQGNQDDLLQPSKPTDTVDIKPPLCVIIEESDHMSCSSPGDRVGKFLTQQLCEATSNVDSIRRTAVTNVDTLISHEATIISAFNTYCGDIPETDSYNTGTYYSVARDEPVDETPIHMNTEAYQALSSPNSIVEEHVVSSLPSKTQDTPLLSDSPPRVIEYHPSYPSGSSKYADFQDTLEKGNDPSVMDRPQTSFCSLSSRRGIRRVGIKNRANFYSDCSRPSTTHESYMTMDSPHTSNNRYSISQLISPQRYDLRKGKSHQSPTSMSNHYMKNHHFAYESGFLNSNQVMSGLSAHDNMRYRRGEATNSNDHMSYYSNTMPVFRDESSPFSPISEPILEDDHVTRDKYRCTCCPYCGSHIPPNVNAQLPSTRPPLRDGYSSSNPNYGDHSNTRVLRDVRGHTSLSKTTSLHVYDTQSRSTTSFTEASPIRAPCQPRPGSFPRNTQLTIPATKPPYGVLPSECNLRQGPPVTTPEMISSTNSPSIPILHTSLAVVDGIQRENHGKHRYRDTSYGKSSGSEYSYSTSTNNGSEVRNYSNREVFIQRQPFPSEFGTLSSTSPLTLPLPPPLPPSFPKGYPLPRSQTAGNSNPALLDTPQRSFNQVDDRSKGSMSPIRCCQLFNRSEQDRICRCQSSETNAKSSNSSCNTLLHEKSQEMNYKQNNNSKWHTRSFDNSYPDGGSPTPYSLPHPKYEYATFNFSHNEIEPSSPVENSHPFGRFNLYGSVSPSRSPQQVPTKSVFVAPCVGTGSGNSHFLAEMQKRQANSCKPLYGVQNYRNEMGGISPIIKPHTPLDDVYGTIRLRKSKAD